MEYLRRDSTEDVDEDEKECDEHGHPARDHLRRNQERDPRHHHEEPGRKIIDGDVFQLVPGTTYSRNKNWHRH